jgi:hypothetical protein
MLLNKTLFVVIFLHFIILISYFGVVLFHISLVVISWFNILFAMPLQCFWKCIFLALSLFPFLSVYFDSFCHGGAFLSTMWSSVTYSAWGWDSWRFCA